MTDTIVTNALIEDTDLASFIDSDADFGERTEDVAESAPVEVLATSTSKAVEAVITAEHALACLSLEGVADLMDEADQFGMVVGGAMVVRHFDMGRKIREAIDNPTVTGVTSYQTAAKYCEVSFADLPAHIARFGGKRVTYPRQSSYQRALNTFDRYVECHKIVDKTELERKEIIAVFIAADFGTFARRAVAADMAVTIGNHSGWVKSGRSEAFFGPKVKADAVVPTFDAVKVLTSLDKRFGVLSASDLATLGALLVKTAEARTDVVGDIYAK
jgi:hypothetical protein